MGHDERPRRDALDYLGLRETPISRHVAISPDEAERRLRSATLRWAPFPGIVTRTGAIVGRVENGVFSLRRVSWCVFEAPRFEGRIYATTRGTTIAGAVCPHPLQLLGLVLGCSTSACSGIVGLVLVLLATFDHSVVPSATSGWVLMGFAIVGTISAAVGCHVIAQQGSPEDFERFLDSAITQQPLGVDGDGEGMPRARVGRR